MKIAVNTKFVTDERVCALYDNKYFEGVIKSISVSVDNDETSIKYWVVGNDDSHYVYEKNLFKTKEELLKSI